MKFSINLGFLNIFKFFRKRKTNTINEKWIDWARRTAVEEVTQNVKRTYDYINIKQFLSDNSDIALEELCLGTSLNLTGYKKMTVTEVKNMFSLSLAESAGVEVENNVLEQIAKYYFDNCYSDETQKEYYKIRNSRK